MAFPLFSVGVLKGLGWGFSIGLDNEDFMYHKASNTKIPLDEVAGISTIKTTNPFKGKLQSVAAYVNSNRFGGGDSTDTADRNVASDLLWNTILEKERQQLEATENKIDHMAGTAKLQHRDTIYNRYYSRILVCLLLPELQCANPPKHTQHTQLTVVLTTHVGYVAPQLRAFMAGGFIVVRVVIWSEFRLNPTYASH